MFSVYQCVQDFFFMRCTKRIKHPQPTWRLGPNVVERRLGDSVNWEASYQSSAGATLVIKRWQGMKMVRKGMKMMESPEVVHESLIEFSLKSLKQLNLKQFGSHTSCPPFSGAHFYAFF